MGYFYNEYVNRRKWLDDRSYSDLVALCQFLPGPASSQVGIGIGTLRAGILGGVAAWLGFTLPSVLILVLFATLIKRIDIVNSGWIHGLKIVAVVIVAHALLGMAQKLIPDRNRATIAILATIIASVWQTSLTQITLIFLAALLGIFLYKNTEHDDLPEFRVPIKRDIAVICLILFFGLLILLPVTRELTSSHGVAMFDSFYRAGSLVFGGGHVVLPLLEKEVVALGWISNEDFLAGYGAAQAVPGPLFTFAAYIGAIMKGWGGATVATTAIFLPAFLLVIGVLPFWDSLRRQPNIQGALLGVNAAVVGILAAACYDPIITSSILAPVDFALAVFLYGMLVYGKTPAWLVVLSGAVGGMAISYI